jgi:hypothetical protein
MYYEDEPYYNSEDFMEEYEQGIRDILTEAVNKKIKDTVDALVLEKSRNEVLTKEVVELKSKIYNAERLHKAEIDKVVKEVIKETERRLCYGFAPHDIVYRIDSKASVIKCDKCNGKGKVKVDVLGKSTEVSCPHCSYGENRTYFYFPKEDIVSNISFSIYRKDRNSKSSGFEMSKIKVWLDKSEYETDSSNLYKSLEECQKVCDEKNSKDNSVNKIKS